MKIAIHMNNDNLFDEKWPEFLENRGIEVVKLDLKRNDILKEIELCDGVMWHFHHSPLDKQVAPKILDTIESVYEIPVWPNYKTRWHFDEKVSQYYLLKALKVPAIKTWVFWDKIEAINFLKSEAKFPLVYKMSVGAGSSNVLKINNYEEAEKIVCVMFDEGIIPYSVNEYAKKYTLRNRLGDLYRILFKKRKKQIPAYYHIQKDYIYFQEFLANNDNDIRITIIGNRAFGYIRFNREGDFRASGSGKFDLNPNVIPLKAVEIAFDVSKRMNFQSMAYDFLLTDDGEPVICEISYGYADWAVFDCPGHWDENLVWHEGHMWPEEAQVEDFIEEIIEKKKS